MRPRSARKGWEGLGAERQGREDHTAEKDAQGEQEGLYWKVGGVFPPRRYPSPSLHLSPASSAVCSCDTGVETGARGSKPFLKCFAQTLQPPGWVKLGPSSRWALCLP